MHVLETTIQVRVTNFEEGMQFYRALLQRDPDFFPHEGFAEWELVPKCWIQVADGEPTPGSGPLRFGVADIEQERARVMAGFGISIEEVQSREGVPAKWCSFEDPWGNRLGFFQEVKP